MKHMMNKKQMEKMSKGKSQDMMGQKMLHTNMTTSMPMGDIAGKMMGRKPMKPITKR